MIPHTIAHASSEHFHILSRRQRYWKPKVGRFQLSKNLTHDKQPNWCIAEIACEIMYAHCTQHASGNDVGKQRRGMRIGWGEYLISIQTVVCQWSSPMVAVFSNALVASWVWSTSPLLFIYFKNNWEQTIYLTREFTSYGALSMHLAMAGYMKSRSGNIDLCLQNWGVMPQSHWFC